MNKHQFAPADTDVMLSAVDQELLSIRQTLEQLPEGTANIYHIGERLRVKGRIHGKQHFFNQNEMPVAAQLMYRSYLETRRKELLHRRKMLCAVKNYESKWLGQSDQFLISNPERADMIREYLPENHDLTAWMKAPAANSAPYQEKRTEPTIAGYNVRSKSEVMIISILKNDKRYFRYEDPLYLGGRIYYPDFTIRSVADGSFFWYEHFGMMDDPVYARQAYKKLSVYAEHGLIPGMNLITTFETQAHKLSIRQICHALAIIP